jgi:hypothetical protein
LTSRPTDNVHFMASVCHTPAPPFRTTAAETLGPPRSRIFSEPIGRNAGSSAPPHRRTVARCMKRTNASFSATWSSRAGDCRDRRLPHIPRESGAGPVAAAEYNRCISKGRSRVCSVRHSTRSEESVGRSHGGSIFCDYNVALTAYLTAEGARNSSCSRQILSARVRACLVIIRGEALQRGILSVCACSSSHDN